MPPMMKMKEDDVAGVIAIQQKLGKLAGLMGKAGEKFPERVPKDIQRALVEVRKLWHRCNKKKDFRWSPGEVSAMNDAAGWIIRKTCELQGRPVPKTAFTPEGVEQV